MTKNNKEAVQYGSALAMLASGVILTFVSFFMSVNGDVPPNVLLYMAQCLIYAGSIFGAALCLKECMDSINEWVSSFKEKNDGADR